MENQYEGLAIDCIHRPSTQSAPNFAGRIEWSAPNLGFGTLDFMWDKEKLCVDTECMSKEFLRRIMILLVDELVIVG